MDGRQWLAVALLIGTVVGVLSRPRRLGEGGAALAGAALALLLGVVTPATALIVTALVVALASNLMNNWPAMLVAVSILVTGRAGGATAAAPYGAVLGADIGSKLTPIGSLATVLWLTLLRRRGLALHPLRYMRVALPVTPVVLAVALGLAVLLVR